MLHQAGENHDHESRKALSLLAAVGMLSASLLSSSAQACTGIFLPAADGTFVHARTMEFAVDIGSKIVMVPRGFARTGTTPDGSNGLGWTAKYASLGANALDLPILVDGLNEAGLGVGLFYFPGFAGYMPYQAADAGKTIAPWELGSWLLDNFANVDEVRAAIGKSPSRARS